MRLLLRWDMEQQPHDTNDPMGKCEEYGFEGGFNWEMGMEINTEERRRRVK